MRWLWAPGSSRKNTPRPPVLVTRTYLAGSGVALASGAGVATRPVAVGGWVIGVGRTRPAVAARVGSAVTSTAGAGDAAGRSRMSKREVLRNASVAVAATTRPNRRALARCHQRSVKPRVRPSNGRPHHSQIAARGSLRPWHPAQTCKLIEVHPPPTSAQSCANVRQRAVEDRRSIGGPY